MIHASLQVDSLIPLAVATYTHRWVAKGGPCQPCVCLFASLLCHLAKLPFPDSRTRRCVGGRHGIIGPEESRVIRPVRSRERDHRTRRAATAICYLQLCAREVYPITLGVSSFSFFSCRSYSDEFLEVSPRISRAENPINKKVVFLEIPKTV